MYQGSPTLAYRDRPPIGGLVRGDEKARLETPHELSSKPVLPRVESNLHEIPSRQNSGGAR